MIVQQVTPCANCFTKGKDDKQCYKKTKTKKSKTVKYTKKCPNADCVPDSGFKGEKCKDAPAPVTLP